MADEVRMVATKDIPRGFKNRPADGGAYHTRMLKAGDAFYTSAGMGEFFAKVLKRAEYEREVGKVAAPPKRVVQAAKAATPKKTTRRRKKA